MGRDSEMLWLFRFQGVNAKYCNMINMINMMTFKSYEIT